jgi:hypothetical protein
MNLKDDDAVSAVALVVEGGEEEDVAEDSQESLPLGGETPAPLDVPPDE